MVNPDRGDYTVGFRAHKDKDTFELTMTPKQMDPQHRFFYADEDGIIHANEEGAADEKSPVVKWLARRRRSAKSYDFGPGVISDALPFL